MTEDADVSLDEKRVHADQRPTTRLVVASKLGLATVEVSDDQIGRFGLAHRLLARDVVGNGRLAVATSEDVLVGDTETLERTAFEPPVAVGFRAADGTLLAASEDGRVAQWTGGDDGSETDGWTTVGTIGAAVRAIDGDLVASDDGAYFASTDLEHLGLADVRDVAAAGPFAATAAGVHRLESEWTTEIEGEATLVASDGPRAHAVVDGTLLERRDGDWVDAGCPAADVVDVAYAEAVYAVTADGTALVDATTAKDGVAGWRSRELGLDDVRSLAAV